MSSNGHNLSKLILRIIAVAVAGIMINITFLANIDTYSWFAKSAKGSAQVTAAETDDILESIEYIPAQKDLKPKKWTDPYLKIKCADGLEYSPLVYFSIEGEASEYILHINPVRLDSSGYYIIPIDTDVNVTQHRYLSKSKFKSVKGTIHVKYMNEFISEPLPVELDRKYLRSRLVEDIIRDGTLTEAVQGSMMRAATAMELPQTLDFEEKSQETDSILSDAIKYMAELVSWDSIGTDTEEGKTSGEALYTEVLKLTSDQEVLMDIIYPGLKRYMEGLKSYIEGLRTEIEEKNAQLAVLDEKLAILESQLDELIEENERLIEQINSMTTVQPSVQPPASAGPDTAQPPAADGGNPGGGSGTTGDNTSGGGTVPGGDTSGGGTVPGGDTPGEGPAPGDGIPDESTDVGTGDNITDGDSGADTGTGSTEGQNEDGTVNEPDTSTDEGTESGDAGNDSQEEEPGDAAAEPETDETPEAGAGDTGDGAETDGSDVTEPEQPEAGDADNGDIPENPTDNGNQDAIVGNSDEEDAADASESSGDEGDTSAEGDAGDSGSTDGGTEPIEPASGE